jgi:hypothetical protein
MKTTGRKKEYHKRVSPIVRNGGRSRDIHIPKIKRKKRRIPPQVSNTGNFQPFCINAATAPAIQHREEAITNQTKSSQLIYSFSQF